MRLAENLQLPVLDHTLLGDPWTKVSPKLVLINLEELQRRLVAGDLKPAEYLAPEELTTYNQFKYPKRQSEWLGGRLAAKQAVLRDQKQEETVAARHEWPICPDEYGRPAFKYPGNNQPGLSISHSHGLALAMTVNGRQCGLDLQKISMATTRVKEKFCSGEEEQLIASLNLPGNSQANGLTMLWSAKEALRKARGGHPLTGLMNMQLTKTTTPHKNCWLFTMGVNSEQHLIPVFFYRDYTIALCII